MASRQPRTIGDLCEDGLAIVQTGPFGSQLHSYDYVDQGVPVIPTEAILRRRIDLRRAKQVSAATAKRLERHRLIRGDILFARRGIQATGLSAIVTSDQEGALCGTGAILLRIRKDNAVVDPNFLSLVLGTDEAIEWLKQHAVGAVMPNLNDSIIKHFPLALPDLHEQCDIARAIAWFDQKIELNRRTNQTLEALTHVIFRSWFVDFDPVRAKGEGRTPFDMDTSTASLFPSHFLETDFGKVPAGWTTERWRKLATLEYGKSLQNYAAAEAEFPVYGTNGLIGWHTRPLCPKPGVIVGRKGAYRGVHLSRTPFYVIDTAFYLSPKQELDIYWAYFEIQQTDINAMDSGSAIPSTSREDFYAIPVVVPPLAVMNAFGETASLLYRKIDANLAESATLAALRDLLLPKLISGEIRLKDAEKELAAI